VGTGICSGKGLDLDDDMRDPMALKKKIAGKNRWLLLPGICLPSGLAFAGR
jgi:hypothetical protein